MGILTRDQLPPDPWSYKYQLGFLLWEKWYQKDGAQSAARQFIIWRTVDRRKFLKRYFDTGLVSLISHPEDVLAVFHAGDVQRFGRRVFRAKKA